MDVVAISILSALVGGLISFATRYFSNLQRYKQDIVKQNSDHNHDLVKQDSEHKYERQVFLRQKYEELTFRLIEFTNILKALSSQLSQEVIEADINSDEFAEKGAKIEIITILYFPELSTDCKDFLAVSHQFLLAHNPLNNSNSINNRELLKVRFEEGFDQLYDKIKKHISDYT